MFLAIISGCTACAPTPSSGLVVTSDIDRFWEAYDAVRATEDIQEKARAFNAVYIDRGSAGLHAMNRARSYTSAEYLAMIDAYPEYLDAIRPKTTEASDFAAEIEIGLRDMLEIFPGAPRVPVYFVMGALRAAGTANDGKILIGAELAMADASLPTAEFVGRMDHLPSYIASSPVDGLVALNLHEYVHALQRSTGGHDLLSQALFEGVAEYVSTGARGIPSEQPSILFGEANRDAVLAAFEADIGDEDFSDWIWNSPDNAFGVRDLGYFVGYAIAEAYVKLAPDRDAAIRELVGLDYQDPESVRKIVDQSAVFSQPIATFFEETSSR